MSKLRNIYTALLVVSLSFLLGGCKKLALLDPQGVIARKEMHLLIDATLLMLIVVVPVMIFTVIVAWRYRAKNKKATYKPNWAHSYIVEAICWTIPCIIILILGVMTWVSSHDLDPYKPVVIKGKKAITIQAIALDWRWLFIYPKQRIATINYVQFPVGTPVRLHITADAPMNSLEIPRLAGQIYAMGGMQTTLYLAADKKGIYKGLSTNYSGDGFAGMTFKINVTSKDAFKKWVDAKRRTGARLTWAEYNRLVAPSKDAAAKYFSLDTHNLFQRVIEKYTKPPVKKIK